MKKGYSTGTPVGSVTSVSVCLTDWHRQQTTVSVVQHEMQTTFHLQVLHTHCSTSVSALARPELTRVNCFSCSPVVSSKRTCSVVSSCLSAFTSSASGLHAHTREGSIICTHCHRVKASITQCILQILHSAQRCLLKRDQCTRKASIALYIL